MLYLQLLLYSLLLRGTSLLDLLINSNYKNRRNIVGPLLGSQIHLPSSRDSNAQAASEVGRKHVQTDQFSGSAKFLNNHGIRSEPEEDGAEMWGSRKKIGTSGGPSPSSNQQTEEQNLLYFLLRQYERAVRPVRNASEVIVIKLGMTMTNIFDVDEKNQVLTINVWLDQEWKDELLRWDPADFNGIRSLRVPCDLIWIPDIVLYNSAEDYTNGYMRSRAMVFFDGTVFWPPPTRLRSTCKISVTYFPFDSQHCSLKFGSWTYHGYQVDVTNRSLNIDLSNYVESGEFDLMSVHQKRSVVKYACCDEPYPDLTFYIHIRRKTLYYLYNIVFPCLMMSILTLLVFFLPPDSGEKIALGITVLLAFSVFVLAIAEKMPETSDSIPLIGIYLTSVMAMTSISVVMTVMVLNFHYRGPFNKPVPDWLHDLILIRIRNFLRMQMPYSGFANSIGCGIASIGNTMLHGLNINSAILSGTDHHHYGDGESGDHLLETSFYQQTNGFHDERRNSTRKFSADHKRRKRESDALQDKLLKILDTLSSRQENDDRLQLMANEWRQVAQVVDRLLFWIFLVLTSSVSTLLLILIPVWHRGGESTEFDESLYGLHTKST